MNQGSTPKYFAFINCHCQIRAVYSVELKIEKSGCVKVFFVEVFENYLNRNVKVKV